MTEILGNPIKVIVFALLSMSGSALAVQPITDLPLQQDAQQRWHLPAGEYRGSFSVDSPMQIVCEPGAVFQAQGQGNGVTVSAPDVTIEGCTFLDWGHDLTAMNSAVFLQPKARGAVIKGNRMQGQGFGIWVDSTHDASLIDNDIQGDPTLRSQDRGNGIHLYAVRGPKSLATTCAKPAMASTSTPPTATCCKATRSKTFVMACTTCSPTTTRSSTTSPAAPAPAMP